MRYKAKYIENLNIATLESKETSMNIRVHTLLQNPGIRQPAINAYLGARYSRSADSISDIAQEIIKSGTDAAQRLETIFVGYGHKSVGDMADLFVCIENIPMVVAAKLFYKNAVVSGQERSTRYQNFKKPDFIKLPPEYRAKESKKTKTYEEIFLKQMQDYSDLLEPTQEALEKYFKPESGNKQHSSALKARTFDTVRYFLPIGLKTSLALLMSARNWSENIARLKASRFVFERKLADIILNLLSDQNENLKNLGYIAEASGLIRHTEANETNSQSTRDILKLLEKVKFNESKLNVNKIEVNLQPNAIKSLILHYYLLKNPFINYSHINLEKLDLEKLGEIIFKYHDHHHLINNLAQTGSISIDGYGDYGAILKDINRHRSLERFFPIQEEEFDFDAELNRKPIYLYKTCNYLDLKGLEKLKDEYTKRLNETYKMISKWREANKDLFGINILDEYTRYLLPHAHNTRYRLYGSFDDLQYLIHLRTRNGGHIAYRQFVYDWAKLLAEKSKIFKAVIDKIPAVDPSSREQFFDRS